MLTPVHVLATWEAGHGRHALDRALILAAVAAPDASWEMLCRLRIGERDRLLLGLREALNGDRVPCYVSCPACSASLELPLRVIDLWVESGAADGELVWEDYRATVRAPDSLDLAAVVRAASPAAGLQVLLERCVAVRRGDEPVEAALLPAPLVDAIAARMAELDPGAELLLALTCIDCGHRWSARFDIVEYLWSEVVVRSHAVLRDTDVLARAYGWSEAEILALPELRRRAYLELARS